MDGNKLSCLPDESTSLLSDKLLLKPITRLHLQGPSYTPSSNIAMGSFH